MAVISVADALRGALYQYGSGQQVKMSVTIVLKNAPEPPPTNPIDWLVGALNGAVNLSQLKRWPDAPQVVTATANLDFSIATLEYRFVLDQYAVDYLPDHLDQMNLAFGVWLGVRNDAGANEPGFDIVNVEVTPRELSEPAPAPAPAPEQQKKPLWAWVGVGLAGVLVLLGLRKQKRR